MMNTGIYEIRNTVNGKRYVGSAINIRLRWRQHRCELGKGRHNPHMQSAWAKHGASAFVFTVLELVAEPAHLLIREQHYIDTLKPEYNCARVAGSNLGAKRSQAEKDKISEASLRVWSSPGYREKMSAAHVGQVFTAEHREKISAANRGRKLSPEHAAIVAKQNAERNRSTEHRQRMSEYWSGRAKTAEQLVKMAATKRGRPLTSEHREKLAEAMRIAHAEGRHNYDRTDDVRQRLGRSAAKLTDAQVLEILGKHQRGIRQSALSIEYGLSQPAMSLICNRKTYCWVKP